MNKNQKKIPGVLAHFGILKSKKPYDPAEKEKARTAIGRQVALKGPRKRAAS